MKLLSTVYFRATYGPDIQEGSVGKIIKVQDAEGYYTVLLTESNKICRVHPHSITTEKPMPKNRVFQPKNTNKDQLKIGSVKGFESLRTNSGSPPPPQRRPYVQTTPLKNSSKTTSTIDNNKIRSTSGSPPPAQRKQQNSRAQTSLSSSSNARPRQTMEQIRADYERKRQETKNQPPGLLKSDTSIPTDNIPLVSHVHGRQRRSERNIERKELQAAVKYGQKETANPGRDGSTRWRYTYNGVVFVTDETSRHEVTSWRIDGKDDEDEADIVGPAEVQLVGSQCHAVLIIDQSGSMRNVDVPGYNSRSHALYECLKRDFVREQLKSGAATDVVVTVISMSDTAKVLLHKKPLDESLIGHFDRLSKERPKSHGNYIPALDKALERMKADAANSSSLLVLFFSDGAPSDQQCMKCMHDIKIYDINRKMDPKMGHKSKAQAWKCIHEISHKVEVECCQRVKAIGQVFGRDKVIFRTLAFGPPNEDFTLLEKMANVLPRGKFQKLGLNATSLRTSFSSLSSSLTTLRTEGGHRVLTRRSDKIVDRNQKVDVTSMDIFGEDGWWIYAFKDFIGKYEFKDNNSAGRFQRVGLKNGANGIAFFQQPFAEGAERFVYRCSEIVAQTYEYDRAASNDNMAGRCGLRLVAKEAKDLENHHQGRKFHETFARIQSEAADLAQAFTRLLPLIRPEWSVNFIQTHVYGCLDDTYRDGEAWILVEPELDGKFTKWNNNAGEVKGKTRARGKLPGLGGMGLLEEEEESDEDSDETGAVQVDDIPQAFSHFSYEYSKGRQLVCDLQGVWNADDGFLLTDPVIHHVCSKGRKHLNGATDKGVEGVKKFFQTHVCNSLCRRMGLPERTPEKLLSVPGR